MAGGITQFVSPLLNDAIVGRASYSRPALSIALCTTTPTATSTGATIVEPTSGAYTGYARVSLTSGTFSAASISGATGVAVTANTITFATSGSGSTGCTVTGFALVDSGTIGAGNVIWYGAFQASLPINANNTPSIPSGNLNLTLTTSGGFSNYLIDKILDHLDNTTTYTWPTSLNVALTSVIPTASMTGATITEPNSTQYDGYARINIPSSDWNAATLSSGVATSITNAELDFPQSASDSTGVTLVGFALLDSATIGAGNMLMYGTLTSQVISAYSTPFFASAAITIQSV